MTDREGDTRNIVDKYKWWDTLDVKDDLADTASNFVAIFLNYDSDFNLSSGIRNGNAFNIKSARIVGRRRVDTRGTVGAMHYMDIRKEPDIEVVIAGLRDEGYLIIAAEITDDAIPLTTYEWADKTAVIFGQESCGVDEAVLALCDEVVYMPMRGSVRSINTANTSGVFMYDYHVKRGYI